MAQAVYGDQDPTDVFFSGKTHEIRRGADGLYELVLPLPFASRGDVTLRQNGDELFVRVGAHRRHIVLPRALAGSTPAGAKLDEAQQQLVVRFNEKAADTTSAKGDKR
jgi:arsenite-transporting ATPase